MMDKNLTIEVVIESLVPYRYRYLVSITGIHGPGNYVVVFASREDFCTACVSHEGRVLWCHSCGSREEI